MSVSFSDIYAMMASRKAAADLPACAYRHVLDSLATQDVVPTGAVLDGLNTVARVQQTPWPTINHPRVALFASGYAGGAAETRKRMASLSTQQDAVARLCARANADLRVYELDVADDVPTAALTEIEAAHALSYGLMAVDEKVDYLIAGSISTGHEKILQQWQDALAADATVDPLTVLCQIGARHDVFALVGAVIAARMAGIAIGCGSVLHNVLTSVWPRLFEGETPLALVPNCAGMQATETIEALLTVLNIQNLSALVALPSTGGKAILPNAA